jgi:hypothetical protein
MNSREPGRKNLPETFDEHGNPLDPTPLPKIDLHDDGARRYFLARASEANT